MLGRLHTDMAEENEGTLGRRRSKRQRIVQFFRLWKQKPQSHDDAFVRAAFRYTPPPLIPTIYP